MNQIDLNYTGLQLTREGIFIFGKIINKKRILGKKPKEQPVRIRIAKQWFPRFCYDVNHAERIFNDPIEMKSLTDW